MALQTQISFDANDPAGLARFWASALGYVEQPPPQGFDSWQAFAIAMNIPSEVWDRFAAIIDEDGAGPRVLFQKVPEGKTAKNRLHLDISASAPDHDWSKVEAHVRLLADAGATVVEERQDEMSKWVVLLDPEGNEFCVQ